MATDSLSIAEMEALLREIDKTPPPRLRRRYVLVRRESGELAFEEDQSDCETICLKVIDEIFPPSNGES
jgi:hypothetical protein